MGLALRDEEGVENWPQDSKTLFVKIKKRLTILFLRPLG